MPLCTYNFIHYLTFEISHVIWYKMNKVHKMIRPNLIRQTEEM